MMMWYCRKRPRFGVRRRDGLGLPTRPDFFEDNAPLAQEGELVPGRHPVDLGLRTAHDSPRAYERAEVAQPVRAGQADENDPLWIRRWLRCTKRRPALGGDGHDAHLSPGIHRKSTGGPYLFQARPQNRRPMRLSASIPRGFSGKPIAHRLREPTRAGTKSRRGPRTCPHRSPRYSRAAAPARRPRYRRSEPSPDTSARRRERAPIRIAKGLLTWLSSTYKAGAQPRVSRGHRSRRRRSRVATVDSGRIREGRSSGGRCLTARAAPPTRAARPGSAARCG